MYKTGKSMKHEVAKEKQYDMQRGKEAYYNL